MPSLESITTFLLYSGGVLVGTACCVASLAGTAWLLWRAPGFILTITGEWRLCAAYACWRAGNLSRAAHFLEKHLDADGRYEKERDELREKLFDYQRSRIDIISLADRVIERYGDGSHENPRGTLYLTDRLDGEWLAEQIEEALRRKDSTNA